jgi:hypothetical protein
MLVKPESKSESEIERPIEDNPYATVELRASRNGKRTIYFHELEPQEVIDLAKKFGSRFDWLGDMARIRRRDTIVTEIKIGDVEIHLFSRDIPSKHVSFMNTAIGDQVKQ